MPSAIQLSNTLPKASIMRFFCGIKPPGTELIIILLHFLLLNQHYADKNSIPKPPCSYRKMT